MNKQTSYTISVPDDVMGKIRLLSARRKAENHAIRTQKAIFVELLEKGLLFADDSMPTKSETPNT